MGVLGSQPRVWASACSEHLLNGCCEGLLRAALLVLRGGELKHRTAEWLCCLFLGPGTAAEYSS